MSFFEPEHITVRSLIHIVGGLFFFLPLAAEQQKETYVPTSHLILPNWELFKSPPLEIFLQLSDKWVPAFPRRITRGCQRRGASDPGPVDKWKEGCWKFLNVWWKSENKTGLHHRDLLDIHRIAQPMGGMSHETGCLNSNEYESVCFPLS